MFEDIDVKRTVTRELMNLEQKKIALMYETWFQKVLFNLSWEDIILAEQFYRSLKNIVKNDIARREWSIILQDMIITAI